MEGETPGNGKCCQCGLRVRLSAYRYLIPEPDYGTFIIESAPILDTAFNYNTEEAIGNVLKNWLESGRVKRDELFITTKVGTYFTYVQDVPLTYVYQGK